MNTYSLRCPSVNQASGHYGHWSWGYHHTHRRPTTVPNGQKLLRHRLNEPMKGAERSRCKLPGRTSRETTPQVTIDARHLNNVGSSICLCHAPRRLLSRRGCFFDCLAAAAGWFVSTLMVEGQPLEGGWVERVGRPWCSDWNIWYLVEWKHSCNWSH